MPTPGGVAIVPQLIWSINSNLGGASKLCWAFDYDTYQGMLTPAGVGTCGQPGP